MINNWIIKNLWFCRFKLCCVPSIRSTKPPVITLFEDPADASRNLELD